MTLSTWLMVYLEHHLTQVETTENKMMMAGIPPLTDREICWHAFGAISIRFVGIANESQRLRKEKVQ